MAGGMNLATKYSRVVDERWAEESMAQIVLSNDNYSFKGDKTVVIYSIPISPLVNYTRSGSNRYGTPSDLSRNIQTMVVSQDKGFTFVIDRGDEVQSEYVSNPGAALAREIREVVAPAFDTYCFRTMAQAAQDNGAYNSTTVTSSNAYEMLLKGIEYFGNHNVPIDNCVCFATYSFGNYLLQDSKFVKYGDASQKLVEKGFIGKAGGVHVYLVPETKLPQGAQFLLVHKDAAIAPKQLEDYKVHENPPGISGYLIEGRILFDCFILDEKLNGIYYHGGQGVVQLLKVMTSATDTGKSTIIIDGEKDQSTNKWYYATATTKAGLPTVTYNTAIDTSASGDWRNGVQLTANPTEITPTSGHKYVAVCEVLSNDKPVKYATAKLNVG